MKKMFTEYRPQGEGFPCIHWTVFVLEAVQMPHYFQNSKKLCMALFLLLHLPVELTPCPTTEQKETAEMEHNHCDWWDA